MGNEGVDVVVLGDEGAAERRRRGETRRRVSGGLKVPCHALEQRASADWLNQPAVKTFERRLPKGAPFERRKQHEAAPDPRLTRGLSQPIGRLGAKRAIDNDDVGLIQTA